MENSRTGFTHQPVYIRCVEKHPPRQIAQSLRNSLMAQATLRAKKPVAKTATPRIRQTKLLINNRWVEPAEGNYFETLNPATGKPIAKVAEGTAADIDKAVKAART